MIELSYTEIAVQFLIKSDNPNAVEDVLKVLSALWLFGTWLYSTFIFCLDIIQSIVLIKNSIIMMFVDRIVSIGFSAFLPGLG